VKNDFGLSTIPGVKFLPSYGHRQRFQTHAFEGWLWDKESEFCIALRLEGAQLSFSWMQLVGLLLAANTAIDDGLFIEQNKMWMLRRYPGDLLPVEVEAKFAQQTVVARVLIDAGQTAR